MPIEKEQRKLLDYILENFDDKILQIFCLAAFVNLIIGVITEGWAEGWMDGFAILIAVIIIVSVIAGNNYIKDQQFRKLNAIAPNKKINVIKGGKTIRISIYDLLVGDIVYVERGDKQKRKNLNRRAGELTEAESQKITEVIADPQSYNIPVWFLNRQKDIRDGKNYQVTTNVLDTKLREDLERLKKIKSNRGLRHHWGLRVRGQHTKTTGRGGQTLGVERKK